MQRLSRILFVGQARAERMRPPRDTALISITDPGRPTAQLRLGWARVLRIAFDDIDPVEYPDDYTGLHAITDAQARSLAQFVLQSAGPCRRLVVHCRYGVSRSAGVAKAVARHVGAAFPPDYADANEFVCRAVSWALSETGRKA